MSLVSSRPCIVKRKAQLTEEVPRRKLLVDFLKSSAIITDNFTGKIELILNQGGLVDVTKVEKVKI